jgi:SAM-dependent methyltransferase
VGLVVGLGGGSGYRQSAGAHMSLTPARWLTDNEDLLPLHGDALDLACGRGRHALWLAARGMTTRAIDRDPEALRFLEREAASRGVRVHAEVMDVESDSVALGSAAYDLIVVFHYLHRPLFPALLAGLRPGGVLVYETFTRAQAARGKPTNPAFLLRDGELRELVRPLEVLREREGDYDGRLVSSVIARRSLR